MTTIEVKNDYMLGRQNENILYYRCMELEHDNKQLKDLLNKANDEVVSYCNCCIDLQQKIDKAIEYIKTKWKKNSHYDSIENCLKFCKINAFEKDDLLQMLGDKE